MKLNINLKELINLENGLTLLLKTIKNINNEKELLSILRDEDLIQNQNDLILFQNMIKINAGELIIKEVLTNENLSIKLIENHFKKNLFNGTAKLGFIQNLSEEFILFIIREYEKADKSTNDLKLFSLEKTLSHLCRLNKNHIDLLYTNLISRSLKHIKLKKNWWNENCLQFKASFASNNSVQEAYIRELFKDRSSYRQNVLKGLASNVNTPEDIIKYLIKKNEYTKELLMNLKFNEELFFEELKNKKSRINKEELITILKYQIENNNIKYEFVKKIIDEDIDLEIFKVLLMIKDFEIEKFLNEEILKGAVKPLS